MNNYSKNKLGRSERIGRMEVSIDNIQGELSDIQSTLKSIGDKISKPTNWSVILSGLAVVAMLWAAAIRPLSEDVTRQEKSASTLATAVLLQNEKLNELKNNTILLEEKLRVIGGGQVNSLNK